MDEATKDMARAGTRHRGGALFRPSKIGRNEPCPCGSGKKSKKCCMDRTVSER
jgi:uncharacterized protein YecA (UPF0149 family)